MSGSTTRTRLSVAVQRAVDCAWLPEKGAIRRWAAAAVGSEHGGEVTVRVVGEAESAALKAQTPPTLQEAAAPGGVADGT